MMPSDARPTRFLFAYVMFTALVCGAAIMVIEVLGSRVIGPFFGVSLFVWTSLISVTLIALATGYWLGGVMADRRGHVADMYMLIAAAGVAALLTPWLKGAVLAATLPLGLRLGAFVSTFLLFGPALVLLGCVSPYLVKIAARTFENIGRTVGGLYALSTVGSVVGTALTGFFLVSYLGVNQAFFAVGTLLLVIAAVYFATQRLFAAVALCLVMPAALTPQWMAPTELSTSDVGVRELFAQDTYYGSVKVVDLDYEGETIRELLIDGLQQGAQDLRTRQSVNRYVYLLQYLPYRLQPAGRDCLVVGLGAGFIPRWYSTAGIRTDVVDIDPLIPELAAKYFDFATSGDVIVADARHYLLTTSRRYDYIILDAYNGDMMPHHLISREMFQLIGQRLREGGVLGINLIGSIGAEKRMTASVLRTLREVFDHVEVYPAFNVNAGDGLGNLEILAWSGARAPLAWESVPNFAVHPYVANEVVGYLRQSYEFPADADAIVLTDDYNPMDFYDAPLREAVRQRILQTTAWGLLTR